jgi:hypothetical protein
MSLVQDLFRVIVSQLGPGSSSSHDYTCSSRNNAPPEFASQGPIRQWLVNGKQYRPWFLVDKMMIYRIIVYRQEDHT